MHGTNKMVLSLTDTRQHASFKREHALGGHLARRKADTVFWLFLRVVELFPPLRTQQDVRAAMLDADLADVKPLEPLVLLAGTSAVVLCIVVAALLHRRLRVDGRPPKARRGQKLGFDFHHLRLELLQRAAQLLEARRL